MGPLFRAYAFSMDTLFRTPTYVVNMSIGIGNPVHDLSTHLGTPMITAIQHTQGHPFLQQINTPRDTHVYSNSTHLGTPMFTAIQHTQEHPCLQQFYTPRDIHVYSNSTHLGTPMFTATLHTQGHPCLQQFYTPIGTGQPQGAFLAQILIFLEIVFLGLRESSRAVSNEYMSKFAKKLKIYPPYCTVSIIAISQGIR